MVAGTFAASIPLAIGIFVSAPETLPTMGYGTAAFYAGGAVSGGAANATSEYLRGGDALSIVSAGIGGAGWSALNPLSGYGSAVGGGVGAGVAHAGGGEAAQGFQWGFQWGELAGGLVTGGIQHYGRALVKYSAGGHGAKAAQMAMRHTAASLAVEGTGIGIGAGVGVITAAPTGHWLAHNWTN